jgi:hypothetical protein
VATVTGNAVTGLDLQTTTVTSGSSTTETGSDGQGDSHQLTQTESGSDGRTQLGNDVSGAFAQQDASTDNTTLTEVGLDAAGGFTIVQTSADSSRRQETGNSVNGNYSLALYLTQVYTLAQTDTARPGAYTVTETGTAWTVRQETGSSLDGTYQATATGSDQYALSETGFEGNVSPVSATLTGVDSSVLSASGNALTGDLSSTQTGQGGVSGSGISGTGVSFTVQESGNSLAGGFALAQTGMVRYALLPQFNNPAGGATPGTELFSGEGPAYGLGPVAGVSGGGAVETGGGSATGAATVRATGYDDGSGRMARVRAAAAAIQSATDPNAGAAQQQPAAQLGAEVYQQYCFRAGTPLKTPTGRKFVEHLRAGDLLLAAVDGRADGPVEAKRIEEVYQGFAHVVNLHVCGRVIGTTPKHRFWVKGLGWVPCAELQAGDLLRSDDGQWVAVECVTDSGEQVPVYNVRVADHKTYFIGCEEWGFSVWAHNAYSHLQAYLAAHGLFGDGPGQLNEEAVQQAMEVLANEGDDAFYAHMMSVLPVHAQDGFLVEGAWDAAVFTPRDRSQGGRRFTQADFDGVAERMAQEVPVDTLTLSPAQQGALTRRRNSASGNEGTRRMGETAAEMAVRTLYGPGGAMNAAGNVQNLRRCYTGPDTASDLDVVFSYTDATDGETKYIVVEAKGGENSTQGCTVQDPNSPWFGRDAEQGSRVYLYDHAYQMSQPGRKQEVQDMGRTLAGALREGSVTYLKVQVNSSGGVRNSSLTVTQFDLSRTAFEERFAE